VSCYNVLGCHGDMYTNTANNLALALAVHFWDMYRIYLVAMEMCIHTVTHCISSSCSLAADCVHGSGMYACDLIPHSIHALYIYVYVLDPSLPAHSGGTAVQKHRRSDCTDNNIHLHGSHDCTWFWKGNFFLCKYLFTFA